MTNNLVGDVYLKIIEEVVLASTNDFEESGVGQTTLTELRQAWQEKLSQRKVAQMPWDPKPEPVQRMNGMPMPASAPNGVPPQAYQGYAEDATPMVPNGARIKLEPTEHHSNPAPAYVPPGSQQGGLARAQALIADKYGPQASSLALPGQQPKPQGLHLPGQHQHAQQQYAQAQHQMMQRQQQAVLQKQQANPRIKVESDSPSMQPGQFPPQQRLANPAYAQTDGADDLADWQSYISQRRALHAARIESNDRMMRDQITAASLELDGGLMLPADVQQAGAAQRKRRHLRTAAQPSASSSNVPQLDGVDDDDEDVKDIKHNEEDADAINSDLDDPEDDQNQIGDDDDDFGDTILCTYDKVQRVKNKWKCTLKDGVLNTGGKEWLFHKGQGEFEW